MSYYATKEGTERYQERFKKSVSRDHYRALQDLTVSSIGFGSYLGKPDDATDARYVDALIRAVEFGCNLVDTAINYRYQRSERAIGSALQFIFKEKMAERDEIVVATKGGYIPFDGAPPADMKAYLTEKFFRTGILKQEDLVFENHSMSPGYIENQLETSLKNLGLQCIDIYYIHNPEEQLQVIPKEEFIKRIRDVFELLEKKVSEGKIRMYGTATWGGYVQKAIALDYLSVEEIARIAREVAGDGNHFKVIQLPFNLGMPEAINIQNQSVNKVAMTPIEAASSLGLSVIASSSLLQSRLSKNLPPTVRQCLRGFETDAQRAIQFVRSGPGVTSALVGMSTMKHVRENMKVATIPLVPADDYMSFFAYQEE